MTLGPDNLAGGHYGVLPGAGSRTGRCPYSRCLPIYKDNPVPVQTTSPSSLNEKGPIRLIAGEDVAAQTHGESGKSGCRIRA